MMNMRSSVSLNHLCGTKSEVWLRIKAAVTGKAMRPLMARESACLGVAILAGIGTGIFEGIDREPEALDESTVIQPETNQGEDELYRRYIDLYETLKSLFEKNAQCGKSSRDYPDEQK